MITVSISKRTPPIEQHVCGGLDFSIHIDHDWIEILVGISYSHISRQRNQHHLVPVKLAKKGLSSVQYSVIVCERARARKDRITQLTILVWQLVHALYRKTNLHIIHFYSSILIFIYSWFVKIFQIWFPITFINCNMKETVAYSYEHSPASSIPNEYSKSLRLQ